MKKIFLTWAITAVCVASITSCGNSSSGEHSATSATEQEGAATQSTATPKDQLAYVCPMNCKGSASMEPGKCPVCNMDLEKNPEFQASAGDSTATL